MRFGYPSPLVAVPQFTEGAYQGLMEQIGNSREPVLLLGRAGSGKTSMLKSLIPWLGPGTAVVAPTAMVAAAIGGSTIHSCFGFSPTVILPCMLDRLPVHSSLAAIETLVVDEVSMVRADIFEAIHLQLQGAKKSNRPFGGVRLVLLGDLFQLPPVISDRELPVLRQFFPELTPERANFMMAPVWKLIEPKIQCYELDGNFRQAEDHDFVELLDRVRRGAPFRRDLELLNSRRLRPQEFIPLVTTTNRERGNFNQMWLGRLPGASIRSEPRIVTLVNERYRQEMVSSPDYKAVDLKMGMKVFFTRNDPCGYYKNGLEGVAVDINQGPSGIGVLVETKDGRQIQVTEVASSVYCIEHNPASGFLEPVYAGDIVSMPLEPAYAMTVHRSQGRTLDHVVVDLGGGIFASGMVYVALSRARNLGQLYLSSAIRLEDCHPPVLASEFYHRNRRRIQSVAPW